MSGPRIAILGAAGLIGFALAGHLRRRGFEICALARRFTRAQLWTLENDAVRTELVSLPPDALNRLLANADIVINCIGVLQDGPAMNTDAVHRQFADRLARICTEEPRKLLIQLSVPGAADEDRTTFSLSKRKAERIIAESGAPYLILRPGFVIAPAAYGGSAMMRALAALPLRLPGREGLAPFSTVAVSDICETVAYVATRWRNGARDWHASWDLVEEKPGSAADLIDAFRAHGGGPTWRLTAPGFLLTLGSRAGDFSAWLGWTPPMRSTAIREMRRGLLGNPGPWIAATGITPLSTRQSLVALPATVQERWFARLYLLKAVILVMLVLFWCLSSLIALTVGFAGAREILLHHGFSFPMAHWLTVVSSLMDFAVGALIAFRRTSRFGLVWGIIQSLGYMVLAAVIAPELWGEPLGALVKTGPAVILMLVALALADDRG
jgi:uncharacterized protein YbjT (DUF2867 family)